MAKKYSRIPLSQFRSKAKFFKNKNKQRALTQNLLQGWENFANDERRDLKDINSWGVKKPKMNTVIRNPRVAQKKPQTSFWKKTLIPALIGAGALGAVGYGGYELHKKYPQYSQAIKQKYQTIIDQTMQQLNKLKGAMPQLKDIVEDTELKIIAKVEAGASQSQQED